jgi:hypothetical protein
MMQYSLRSLMIVVAVIGCLPALLGNIWISFAGVLITSIVLGLREFSSDFDSEPPNFG